MEESTSSKTIQTLWLFQAFLIPGINNSVLGPTIIDLQYFLHEPGLKRLSYLFMLNGCGTIVGSALSSALPKKHLRLRLSVVILMTSVVLILTPLVPTLPYFTLMFLLHSILKGMVICYSIEFCCVLWSKKNVAMQFVVAGATLGSMLTPLIAAPFLSMSESAGDVICLNPKFALTSVCKNEGELPREGSSTLHNSWKQIPYALFNTSVEGRYYNINDATLTESTSLVTNQSFQKTFNIEHEAPNLLNLSGDSNTSNIYPFEVVTHVRWAFVLLGALTLPCGCAILYYWFKHVAESSHTEYQILDEQTKAVTGKLEKAEKLEKAMLVLVVMFSFSFAALSLTYCGLLTIYGVAGPLALSKSVMTRMTSVFYCCSLTGKIANGALSSVLEIDKVIALNLLFLLPSCIALTFLAPYNLTLLWICNICFGVCSSPYSGAILAYTDKYATLSPRVISLVILSSGTGNMILPYLGSVLMEAYWPIGHMYILLCITVYMTSLFITMCLIASIMDRKKG